MQKISFDAEDFPPPSYYTKEQETDGHSQSPAVHQTVKQRQPTFDKSEWWKAPEFVPRSVSARLSSNSCVIHTAGPNIPNNFCSGGRAVSGPAPVYPLRVPPVGYQAPPLVPLPLPTPNWSPGPLPLNVLQAQLARAYAHNPRTVPGQHPTAYHNHKLQQLILQQHRARLTAPFGPSAGYSANVTSIDGLGGPIPAIVLKRKRKKKNKRHGEAKQQQQQGAADTPISENGPTAEAPGKADECTHEEEGRVEMEDGISLDGADGGRSEPDLTMCDVLIGAGADHSVHQSCYYPNDLDLIQSANQSAMITGSCPDLSTETWSKHINPFDTDNGEDFELDTNPVVRDTMRQLAKDGARSERVRELNRKVIEEMGLGEKASRWSGSEEDEEDEEDGIFQRLLKNENERKGQTETNPGKGQKSLREELEEGLLLHRNRAMVHRTAVVHGPRKAGDAAQTMLMDDMGDSEEEERVRITVNALDALDTQGAQVYEDSADGRPLGPMTRSRTCCAIM